MITDALVWVGEHAVAVLSLGIAALALGAAIFLGRDVPPPEQDEHATAKFVG